MRPRALPSWILALAAASPPAAGRADDAPTPAQALAALTLADPRLTVELVAAEPDVASPVALAWDENGRLFVAEMTDYPMAPSGGTVRLLEDRDNDGKYERSSVFADKLAFPNGLLPWKGGLLVTAAPDLLFLEDTDGDGKADKRTVILTGFGEGNQQLRVNSPTWGLDNHIYLANGRSGGAIRRPADPPDRAVPIPRNDLRFDPRTRKPEPIAGFSQFGLPRDDWGDRFPSWNTVPIRHVVLEARDLTGDPESIATRTVADILDLNDGGRIYSLAPSQRRFNAETVAYFNATCGPTLFRGTGLGSSYRGDAFICEPLTSVVHHRRLEPAGPTYVARRVEAGKEFLASTHPWFRPTNLATGPDGALYVTDFCRAWVEHPAFVPEKLRNSVDFREGHERGRIWRIRVKDSDDKVAACRPGKDDLAALIAHLGHDNGWCRDTAQRLLVTRQERAAIVALKDLLKMSASVLARVHALWTLEGLRALDEATIRLALHDGSARVREQAVRLAGGRIATFASEVAGLAGDDDIRVRLHAGVALAALDTGPAREALAKIAATDGDSPYASAVVLSGASRQPGAFLAVLSTRQPGWLLAPTPAQARFLSLLAEKIARSGNQEALKSLVSVSARQPGSPAAFALMGGAAQASALAIGVLDEKAFLQVRHLAAEATRDHQKAAWVRALGLESAVSMGYPGVVELTVEALEPRQPAEVQAAALRCASRLSRHEWLATMLMQRWETLPLASRRTLVGLLVSSPGPAAKLVEAVKDGTVSPAELDPTTREALRRLNDPRLKAEVEKLFANLPSNDRAGVVKGHLPSLTLKPDPARGQTLFATHCQTCHARDGQGARVGPDLISVVGKPAETLLVSILDPAREAAPDGLGVVVSTTGGQTLTGLLAEETPSSIRLRRPGGLDDVIPRNEVESLRPTGRSLMPDGLEQVLRPQDLADLIAFLRSPATPSR